MPQESAQLNKNLLKHLRRQKCETQAATAEACFIGLRQFQNIEKDGCTTTRVINSLAKHFGIPAKELSTNISQDNSLWYIKNPYSSVGEIVKGYYAVIDDIKKIAKGFAEHSVPRLKIVDGNRVKEISIAFGEQELNWALRPLELNEKIGLLWTDLSEWQQDTWEDIREELLYGCVEEVCLNGTPLVPEGAVPKFIVEFREIGKRQLVDTGYRIFNSAAEFRVSFSQWLDTIPLFFEPTRSELGFLNMAYDFRYEMTKTIRIKKVWVNERGESMKAPWSAANIDSLIKAMTDKTNGRRNWPLPIGINENFDGEEVAPFEPDVTYRKVTEIPEIDFSITFEQLNPNAN
ncbi:hypothetical protein [Arsukibacterium sp.]|uniref:hypothetical protein n=1 Tax=Arsukibacterium sp. TaxID=1977258 RepID=UPI00299CEE46|nr:hypothetical protein [Arsukibacterium sp.]MDX1539262.1 hypothetical protein [Arsukibacterium sp.]